MQSKYCIPTSRDSVTILREIHKKNLHSPLAGIRSRIDKFRLRECNQNFTSPQAEILYLFRFMVPASGDAHKNFHFPLAGIRFGIDNSACGDAIKILHFRERRFCNNFAEMHINNFIPPRGNTIQNRQFRLRECNQNFTSPQAEILYFISVHGPRERRCT